MLGKEIEELFIVGFLSVTCCNFSINGNNLNIVNKPAAQRFVRHFKLTTLVRAGGIEPPSQAWEAHILPMYYAR